MTADDEGDDSSRLLSRQGPDLQDGGASSETRDHIFASGGENPVYWPPAAAGRRTSLKGTARRRRHFRGGAFTTALPMELPVGGASAAPPFRADVANGGSGRLFRQPRGGSRGGAAVAVAPSQLGGAWGAERLPAIPRDNGPHPSRMPRPRCAAQAPSWESRCAAFLHFEEWRMLRRISVMAKRGWEPNVRCSRDDCKLRMRTAKGRPTAETGNAD